MGEKRIIRANGVTMLPSIKQITGTQKLKSENTFVPDTKEKGMNPGSM
jgi:hypothetical protein